MDQRLVDFLAVVAASGLDGYLSEEGKELIRVMRERRDLDRYEAFLDECVEMGMDRDTAIKMIRKPPYD